MGLNGIGKVLQTPCDNFLHVSCTYLILGRLALIPLPDNWGNSPINSLLNIFRSWLPRTRATLSQRIAALDQLIRQQPDIAFSVLKRLVNTQFDMANSQPGPTWRDHRCSGLFFLNFI